MTKKICHYTLTIVISLLAFSCNTKKDKDPQPSFFNPPAPNSQVKSKDQTTLKSFTLTQDLYTTNENIQITSLPNNAIAHLWLFGDLQISREVNPVVIIAKAGIIPVTHIMTINDTLQNVYTDTLYIGNMKIDIYRFEAIAYPDVYIKIIYSNNIFSQSYRTSTTTVPFSRYPYYSTVFPQDPAMFGIYDGIDNTLLISKSLDFKTIDKTPLNSVAGKILCLNESGNTIWLKFHLE